MSIQSNHSRDRRTFIAQVHRNVAVEIPAIHLMPPQVVESILYSERDELNSWDLFNQTSGFLCPVLRLLYSAEQVVDPLMKQRTHPRKRIAAFNVAYEHPLPHSLMPWMVSPSIRGK